MEPIMQPRETSQIFSKRVWADPLALRKPTAAMGPGHHSSERRAAGRQPCGGAKKEMRRFVALGAGWIDRLSTTSEARFMDIAWKDLMLQDSQSYRREEGALHIGL
ncbi:hypothetical protein Mapa_014256 [Marchantia paleacea]|nr:hypothetical protein Mapa_014256 [Marchantia paleacea]